jgi:hypothetical protein
VISLATPLTTRLRRRVAAGLAAAVVGVLPLAFSNAPVAQADSIPANSSTGYWTVASDGGIFAFGGASFYGSTGSIHLNQPIVGMAATRSGKGYWMVATDGGIFAFGDAGFFGSAGSIHLNKPIVGMAATPSGKGYWLVASDGGIFSFGDAGFFGSTGNIHLNKPIVGMTSSPSGNGYWMVASDGGIFSFGDTKFFGSTGSMTLNKPITGMASTPSGKGYWLTASDGGVFSYGDAAFFGAAPSRPAPAAGRTVTAMVPAADGAGYWQASTGGEVLAFGSAPYLGGAPSVNKPIVGMAAFHADPAGPTVDPTGPPGGGGTTPTTTTPATLPPYTGPALFSSTAKLTWGSPNDPTKQFKNRQGGITTPYAQNVAAIAEVGNRVYIGGNFTDLVSPSAPGGKGQIPSGLPMSWIAELDTAGGAPIPGSAFTANVHLDGPVRALLASADGKRLYVGGEFEHVNGEIHRRLVALDPATGQIDRSFNPPEPSGYVASILQSGSTLYIGGGFNTLATPTGVVNQMQLAALDAATGNLNTTFVPPPHAIGDFEGHTGTRADVPTTTTPYGIVDALAITGDGQYLMVGGTFLHFGTDDTTDPNHTHSGLIALDPATGALTTWQPTYGSNSSRPVFGLTIWPGDNNTVFAASGGAGGRVVAWTPGKGTKSLWTGNMDGDVVDVAATPTMVYAVGHYDHVVIDPKDPCLNIDKTTGGVKCPFGLVHRHLVAMDPHGELDASGKNTGRAAINGDFNAQADTSEGPNTVFLGANQMYVGGNFSKVASAPVGSGAPEFKQGGFAMYPPM